MISKICAPISRSCFLLQVEPISSFLFMCVKLLAPLGYNQSFSGLFVSVGRCPKILGLSAFRGGSEWASKASRMGGILQNCYQGFRGCSGFPKARDWWIQVLRGTLTGTRWEMCSTKSFSQLESCRANRNFSKERLLDYFNWVKAIQSLSITEKMTELLCRHLAWKNGVSRSWKNVG